MDRRREEDRLKSNISQVEHKLEGAIDQIVDSAQEFISRPSKPIEKLLEGAFETTDESRSHQNKMLLHADPQTREEALRKMQQERQSNRTVVGTILDKAVRLAEIPVEMAFKPFDRLFGFQKNPLVSSFDSIYELTKEPVDRVYRPVEKTLKKMAGLSPDRKYEISVRWKGTKEKKDAKLFTRLTDGTLNIADRLITRPLEIVMRPFDAILGFEDRKNPLVETAHSLKNATKQGTELFTRTLDRMIEEIAEIGDYKTNREREEAFERRKKEASRVVKAMDRIHELVQAPFEILLRPISVAAGFSRGKEKTPLLLAWDVIHQVFRVPVQIITKPIEDAIFDDDDTAYGGDGRYRDGSKDGYRDGSKDGYKDGPLMREKQEQSRRLEEQKSDEPPQNEIQKSLRKENKSPNIFINNFKKLQRLAISPIDLMTSPLRKLILGKHSEDEPQGTIKDSMEAKHARKELDKIAITLSRLNNVLLKPLEIVTQPLSDILTGAKKEVDKMETDNDSKPQSQSWNQERVQGSSMDFSLDTKLSLQNQNKENYGRGMEQPKNESLISKFLGFTTSTPKPILNQLSDRLQGEDSQIQKSTTGSSQGADQPKGLLLPDKSATTNPEAFQKG